MMNSKSVLPIVLSILGIGGVAATAILVAKETPKFNKDIENLKKEEKTKKLDIVKVAVKDYAPALIVGTATIASVASSTILSKKNEISLSSVALLADSGWRKYKDKVKQIFGLDSHKDILEAISLDDANNSKINFNDIENLYWEEHVGFFKANPEKLAYAYSNINRRLHDEEFTLGSYAGVSPMSKFFEDSGAEFISENINLKDIGFGWDIDHLYDMYGYVWVNLELEEVKDEQNCKYTKLLFLEDPIFLDEYTSFYKGE